MLNIQSHNSDTTRAVMIAGEIADAVRFIGEPSTLLKEALGHCLTVAEREGDPDLIAVWRKLAG